MDKNYMAKMRVKDLIVLCHIIDDFETFNQRLVEVISLKNNRDYIFNLWKVSKGEYCLCSRKIKKFYKDNKEIIDTINLYSSIVSFVADNYDYQGNPSNNNSLQFFYKYVLAHREQLNEILVVLEKLINLGFYELEFNENWDFSYGVYEAEVWFPGNRKVIYFDNMEVLPSYETDIVKYKTSGSVYKMSLSTGYNAFLTYGRKIRLNTLIFDISKLPKEISKEEIFDKIIGLQIQKKAEYSAIRSSVDFSVDIEDLFVKCDNINTTISKLNDVIKKEELFKLLSEIRDSIVKMQIISGEYDKGVVADSSYITEELLKTEKKAYQRRREFSKVHLD